MVNQRRLVLRFDQGSPVRFSDTRHLSIGSKHAPRPIGPQEIIVPVVDGVLVSFACYYPGGQMLECCLNLTTGVALFGGLQFDEEWFDIVDAVAMARTIGSYGYRVKTLMRV